MWGPNTIVYISFFIALYFESFLLVTFLSEPARKSRIASSYKTKKLDSILSTAIIIPCLNEENTVEATVESLLALEYPKEKLSIILVDDGSTDNTINVMRRYKDNPCITIHKKENGASNTGKYTALNTGIKIAGDVDLIGCLDADSFVEPDALRIAVESFNNPKVMATTSAMSVHMPSTIIQHMQYAEYVIGITIRHILASVNSLYVTPGPFSLYRSQVFKEIGYFSHGYQTEDMEMALRMQKAHMLIENSPRARVYTKAPSTINALIKQRVRWTSGFLRNMLFDYRKLIGNPHHGILGVGMLPLSIFSIITVAGLFLFSIFQFVANMIHMFIISRGIPISYVLTPSTFDWFYFPISTILLISIVLVFMTMLFMIIGKQISHTPGKLTKGIIAFFLLYWIISPIWRVRAVADTLTNTHRTWR